MIVIPLGGYETSYDGMLCTESSIRNFNFMNISEIPPVHLKLNCVTNRNHCTDPCGQHVHCGETHMHATLTLTSLNL